MEQNEKPIKRIAVAVITRDGKILVARRAEGAHLAGTWEFPGGKIEPKEKPGAAAVRECAEELGWPVRARKLLAVHQHDYEDFAVKLHAVWCALPHDFDVASTSTGAQIQWVTWDELLALNLPPANHALIEKVRSQLDPSRYEIVVTDNAPESEE